jgi:formylglycine-generating enzyme required for sulfatase activity
MELDVAFAPGGEYDARWKAAAQEIADVYPGIRLGVQMGLVPIGRDPASGLWEFWHVQSGEEPLRDDEGKLQLTETTGLVLVLQRGGSFAMGAEPSGPQSALPTLTDAVPVHEVQLSPFFLSKYEMTQGQWLRVTGQNPSRWPPGGQLGGVTLQHPVETVDWHTARRVLGRLGLTLPSEAQWEFGCRGGSAGPFSCPAAELKAHANLADRAYGRAFTRGVTLMEWDDGFQFHAPAGSFEPNALGLHDMHGNLWEWCLDGYEEGFYRDSPPADPVARWRGATHRVLRGGSFMDNARFARSSHRAYDDPQNAADTLGLRPAKGIAPPGTGFARRTDGGG